VYAPSCLLRVAQVVPVAQCRVRRFVVRTALFSVEDVMATTETDVDWIHCGPILHQLFPLTSHPASREKVVCVSTDPAEISPTGSVSTESTYIENPLEEYVHETMADYSKTQEAASFEPEADFEEGAERIYCRLTPTRYVSTQSPQKRSTCRSRPCDGLPRGVDFTQGIYSQLLLFPIPLPMVATVSIAGQVRTVGHPYAEAGEEGVVADCSAIN